MHAYLSAGAAVCIGYVNNKVVAKEGNQEHEQQPLEQGREDIRRKEAARHASSLCPCILPTRTPRGRHG
jgi:hypothetical protein